MGWVVNATPWPLYPRKRDPVPILYEVEWAPGPVWTGAENLAPTGIRSPDRPASSELLCRLLHPGPKSHVISRKMLVAIFREDVWIQMRDMLVTGYFKSLYKRHTQKSL
jgi:hypothetical protein